MLIVAQPAHDADGKAVSTTLSSSEGNIVTETVHYKEPGITYPVVAGVGWEGGFTMHVGEVIEHKENEKNEMVISNVSVSAPLPVEPTDQDGATVSGAGKLIRTFGLYGCNKGIPVLNWFACEAWKRNIRGFFYYNGFQSWFPANRHPVCWNNHATLYYVDEVSCEWLAPNHQKYVAGAWMKPPEPLFNVYLDTEKWHITAQTRFYAGEGAGPVSYDEYKAISIAGLGDGRVFAWGNDHQCNPMVEGCIAN